LNYCSDGPADAAPHGYLLGGEKHMQTTALIVMLILAGGGYGGPATIQGFDSLQACEASKKTVFDFYDRAISLSPDPKIKCVELVKGEKQ
jgi:hypothetical protein